MNNRKVSIRILFAVVITLLMGVSACLTSPTGMPPTLGPDFQSTIDALNTQVADQVAGLATEQNIAPTSITPPATDTSLPPSIIQPQLIASGGEKVQFHIDKYVSDFNVFLQTSSECPPGAILYLDSATANLSGFPRSTWIMGDFVGFNSLLTVGDHIVLVDGCPTLKWELWTIGTPPFEVVFNKDFGYFNYRFLINEGANYLVSIKLTSGAVHLMVGGNQWDVYATEEHPVFLDAGSYSLEGFPLNATSEYSVSIRKP